MPRRRRLPLLRAILAIAVAACAAGAGSAAAADPLPSDDRFAGQWALQPDGPLAGPAAWRIARGAGQVVAVIDSGVDLRHPDLSGSLWVNPREVAGNARDDDANGFTDDIHGADLVNRDGVPEDTDGHGTHVAGIIAAQLDGAGIVGLAPEAKVMAVRVLAKTGGTADVVAEGVRYAVANGATIINLSLSGDGYDERLDEALKAARAADVLVVASAGNGARDLDVAPAWPASAPEVLAAAASDENNLLAWFSNFGDKTVDLAAPGTMILSTKRGGGYELRYGTSTAAPAIAAAAALVRSAAPGLGAAAVRELLVTTAAKPAGLLKHLRAGELDPVAALRRIAPAQPPLDVTARVKQRGRTRALVTWKVAGDSADVASFRISGAGGRKLATKRAGARGVWVARRHRRVRVAARDRYGRELATATVRLR